MADPERYDEMGLFHENAAEHGLAYDGPPAVDRVDVEVARGQHVSALRWGTEPPALVLLHGGAQNAHTWDTVALALDVPLVAVDLPGHGRSSWRDDHDYSPAANAEALAAAVERLAPAADLVVGMSLGGLSALALADLAPRLVRRLLLIDVTPGVDKEKAAAIIAFVDGPQRFDSFDELLERTMAFNPTRSESSLRRGILHNARPLPDGSWEWRYDRGRPGGDLTERMAADRTGLWDVVEAYRGPFGLVKGAESPVVGDDDLTELRRRRPDASLTVVDGAGHSVQGDRPVELARLIDEHGRA